MAVLVTILDTAFNKFDLIWFGINADEQNSVSAIFWDGLCTNVKREVSITK